jgi:DNA-binding GntR family transcriptional regulator
MQAMSLEADRMRDVESGRDRLSGERQKATSRTIDRASYEPAYVQLVNILRHDISAGVYQSGDQLPTEAKLRAAYDVSPMTVRRAINVLLDQGAVSTTRGRGTFVKPVRLAAASFDLSELHDLLDDERVTVRLLEARVVSAGARAAANLDIPEGTRVVSIKRLLEREAEPLVYHRESLLYDPERPIVEAELSVTALRDMFEGGAGVGPKRGELVIHASVLTEEEARHVGGLPGGAALVLEHLFYGFDDKPISWGRFVCRGELLQFKASVGVQAPDEPSALQGRRR